MAATARSDFYNSTIFCKNSSVSLVGFTGFPLQECRTRRPSTCFLNERIDSQYLVTRRASPVLKRASFSSTSKKVLSTIPRCSGSSNSNDDSSKQKVPFGYTRKDVILIGVGVTLAGYGLKSGLEFLGVDPLQAGNVVQLVLVLGLTVGWISTYIFRVSNKEMTYAQQLRDYGEQVMQKRLESLTEAELVALMEQVEEEKSSLAGGEQAK